MRDAANHVWAGRCLRLPWGQVGPQTSGETFPRWDIKPVPLNTTLSGCCNAVGLLPAVCWSFCPSTCPSPGNTCLGSSPDSHPNLPNVLPAVIGTRSANPDLPCSVEGSLSPSLTRLTMSPFTCMMAHRHCHNPTSWAVAKASTNFGGTVRSLGAAQNNNSNHADCKLGRNALQKNGMFCTLLLQEGSHKIRVSPSTRMPCAAEGRLWSPTHTVAFSLTILAATVNSSHPRGSATALFQTFVFP